ncbi:MAG: phosphate signaling complex protein PhoU [Fidelibacterota bacterium]
MTIHFEREITDLKKNVLLLGSLVEESLDQAREALLERDHRLAKQVIKADERIDMKEIEIEEDCLKILALHQPVATDLRFVVSVLKINNDLERIGDLATGIARRVKALADKPEILIPDTISEMAYLARDMVKQSLDALVNLDYAQAEAVINRDRKMDKLHRSMYAFTYEKIANDRERSPAWMEVITISRFLERIADHSTNIAEDVIYLINGEIIRHSDL